MDANEIESRALVIAAQTIRAMTGQHHGITERQMFAVALTNAVAERDALKAAGRDVVEAHGRVADADYGARDAAITKLAALCPQVAPAARRCEG